MLMLDDEGIAVSTRSACATGSLRASHVLFVHLGLSHADAQGTWWSASASTTPRADVERFLASLKTVVTTLRDISPLYQKEKAAGA